MDTNSGKGDGFNPFSATTSSSTAEGPHFNPSPPTPPGDSHNSYSYAQAPPGSCENAFSQSRNSFDHDFNTLGTSSQLFNDISRDSLIDSLERHEEGSSNVTSVQLHAKDEQEDPRLILHRALVNCTLLQLPASLVDANSALYSMGSATDYASMREGEFIHLPPENKHEVVNTWFVKGLVHFQQGLFDLAVEDCSVALRINPSFSPAYVLRGLANLNLGLVSGLKSTRFSALSDKALTDFKYCMWPSPSLPQQHQMETQARFDCVSTGNSGKILHHHQQEQQQQEEDPFHNSPSYRTPFNSHSRQWQSIS
eukprot:TRINITY_DN9116_c0_g3_i3.p1 TRINITY_DN9116_c0_g3~~TRINITY_DN9116_c0_g3_i3.p1  ORF type:complete len:364 (-),score=67.06 TRINITY_DN9116_c0_g3_i3:87-1016(-)